MLKEYIWIVNETFTGFFFYKPCLPFTELFTKKATRMKNACSTDQSFIPTLFKA